MYAYYQGCKVIVPGITVEQWSWLRRCDDDALQASMPTRYQYFDGSVPIHEMIPISDCDIDDSRDAMRG